MSQRSTRRLTPRETAIMEGRFVISDLKLTGAEEEYLTDQARARIITAFCSAPRTKRRRDGSVTLLTVPGDIEFFVRCYGMRNGQLATEIQYHCEHFIVWRTLKQGRQLATLSWLLELPERPAVRIMAAIEQKFIHLVIDDLVAKNQVVRHHELPIWVMDASRAIRPAPRKRPTPKDDRRPNHGRPRIKSRNTPGGTSTGTGRRSRVVSRKSW